MPRIYQTSILLFTLLLLLLSGQAHAQFASTTLPINVKTDVYRLQSTPKTLLLTLTLDLEPDWYTYGHEPGDTGKPTVLTGMTQAGSPITAVYPPGKRKRDAFDPSVVVNAYQRGDLIYAFVPADSPIFPLTLRLDLLLCHPTKCIPARLDMKFGDQSIQLDELPLASNQAWWNEFAGLNSVIATGSHSVADDTIEAGLIEWKLSPVYLHPGLEVSSLFSAILMGLLAGLILNIMPCVLPVVSLKLSALLNAGTNDNEADRIHAFREHNFFFCLGVLAFFLFLAIVLGATGKAWGALFQHQWLVLTVAGIIFALSLSLFGLFHLPVIDLKFGTESKSPRIQAFFTGNLTTLLATPCSGPFLGGVLSWALVQGPLIIATVFISIGFGMASPYILLIIFPSLSRFLPRSGPWIEYVEKSIAFFLIGTSFYLIAIALGDQTLRILAPLWVMIFGSWLWHRAGMAGLVMRWSLRLAAVSLLAASIIWTTPSDLIDDPWEQFSPIELSERIGKERIFLDFTADWCPTCKVLEGTVLTPENVTRWERQYNVAFIKVDMTERDPEAEALLKALGSASIPTAALFSEGEASQSPMVLRDLFTETQLENILKSWEN